MQAEALGSTQLKALFATHLGRVCARAYDFEEAASHLEAANRAAGSCQGDTTAEVLVHAERLLAVAEGLHLQQEHSEAVEHCQKASERLAGLLDGAAGGEGGE